MDGNTCSWWESIAGLSHRIKGFNHIAIWRTDSISWNSCLDSRGRRRKSISSIHPLQRHVFPSFEASKRGIPNHVFAAGESISPVDQRTALWIFQKPYFDKNASLPLCLHYEIVIVFWNWFLLAQYGGIVTRRSLFVDERSTRTYRLSHLQFGLKAERCIVRCITLCGWKQLHPKQLICIPPFSIQLLFTIDNRSWFEKF